jgi:hypothetical protein
MIRAARFCSAQRPRDCAREHSLAVADLETIRPWEKNADNYSSTCANGAFVLMERKFASPDERLRSLIAREKQMPALLGQCAREPEESAAHLYRDCHRAVAGHHELSLSTTCRWPLPMRRTRR